MAAPKILSEKRPVGRPRRGEGVDWGKLLELLRNGATIVAAASEVRVGIQQIYDRCQDNESFRDAYYAALGMGVEARLHAVAMGGVTATQQSVTASIFLLKGLFPERYADRSISDIHAMLVPVVVSSQSAADALNANGSFGRPPELDVAAEHALPGGGRESVALPAAADRVEAEPDAE